MQISSTSVQLDTFDFHSITCNKGQQPFFCEQLDSEYFKHCRAYGLCNNCSALML